MLFVKQKKLMQKEGKAENEKVSSLAKKLNAIENKNIEEKKTIVSTFYKSAFKRLVPRIDQHLRTNLSESKMKEGSKRIG